MIRSRLVAAALILLAAVVRSNGAEVPNCAFWNSGSSHVCPPTNKCKLWDTPRNGIVLPFYLNTTNCEACSDGLGLPLDCLRCKPGFVHVSHDHFRQECLSIDLLGCRKTRSNPQLPRPKALLDGPCTTCKGNRVLVWATSRAEDFYKQTAISVAPRAAAAAAAAVAEVQVASGGPQAPMALPAAWPFPEMNNSDYDNFKGARTWKAQAACMTCEDLGCPGKCKPLIGCTACPKGSLWAAGTQVSFTGVFSGEYKWGWLYDYPSVKAPPLPAMCHDPVKILNCPVRRWNAQGCTKCPPGFHRRRWWGMLVGGSNAATLRTNAWACWKLPTEPTPPPPKRRSKRPRGS